MQVSIPDSLKFFRTSHFVRGKCRVELEASTGIVMDQQERTTTRVYGDNRGVGSTVSVDQALWLKFENGKEQCIDFPNTDIYLSRPGHKITFISATNQLDPKKYNAYIAFYNHTTDKFHYYFYGWWKRVLYKSPPLGFFCYYIGTFLFYGLLALILRLMKIDDSQIMRSNQMIIDLSYFVRNLSDFVSTISFKLINWAPVLVFGWPAIFWITLEITDRRYTLFEKHLEKIVEDFRKQLKES
jgi:hypothetical protein